MLETAPESVPVADLVEGEVKLAPVSETPIQDMIKKTDMSPEEQLDFQMQIVEKKQEHLNGAIENTIMGLLNLLTAQGVDKVKQARIKKSILTGIMSGLDYGVNVAKYRMEEKGIYAKYEGYLGATIAQARENGMILISYNYRKQENEKLNASDEQNQSVGGIDEQSKDNQEDNQEIGKQASIEEVSSV